MTDETEVARLPDEHFIAKLAVELTMNDGWVGGIAPIRPELFAPGTERIRTGLLATMVDLVAGHAPSGPIGPTVDLRVELLSPPPTHGHVHLACHPLRVGSRLVVSETLLRADPTASPFARALTTFMNVPVGPAVFFGARPIPSMDEASFDDFIGACRRDDGSFEVIPKLRIANGLQGTVQGGAQALLAEVTAEHALATAVDRPSGRFAATDLDIRYLGRIRVGPLVATAELLPGGDGPSRVSVRLTDDGDDRRLVGYLALTLEPIR